MRASACPSSCTSTSSLSAPISNATSLTRPESLSPLLSGAVSPRSGLVSRLSLSCTVGCTGASYTLLDTFLPPCSLPSYLLTLCSRYYLPMASEFSLGSPSYCTSCNREASSRSCLASLAPGCIPKIFWINNIPPRSANFRTFIGRFFHIYAGFVLDKLSDEVHDTFLSQE